MSQTAIIGGVVVLLMCSSSSAAMLMMGGGEEKTSNTKGSGGSGGSGGSSDPPKYRYVRIIRDKDGGDHWMNLAEVEVFSGGTNVASGKTVTQSSISHPGTFDPPNLVDGNKTNFAHTNNGAVEWFLIDLGQDYDVEKVVITNRTDCCQGRLRNTKIQLSKAADMSSPKESRVVTTEEGPKATITWMPKLGAELTAA
jgi:hypothetical protein